MDFTDNTTDTSRKIAALRVLFAAVAASAGLPGTASAFNAPPPIASPCTVGTWSSTGRTPCQLANVGHFVPTTGATSQTPAPLGSYVDTTGATVATPAPKGSYVAISGATAATLAPPGSYVGTTGAIAATLASPGSYVAITGATAATLASPGSYVAINGATGATPAPKGSYVAISGATSATPATPGSYVGTIGATAATPAPKGSYVAITGATAATPAAPGSYVAITGATTATLAPLGSYVDTVGATAAKLAPVGYYVDMTGQTAPLAAPAGRFASGLGSSAALPCPTGSNSYGAGSACRIIQEGSLVAGVTPLLGSTFGTGGSHALGSVLPGDSFLFEVANTSADMATPGNLTTLTLLSYTLSDPTLFDLVGFTEGMELAAGGGLATLSLHAKAGLPVGAFSFSLTLNTDQYADYRTAGQQFSYTFTGIHAAIVPEPGSTALLLAGLGALALLRRRKGPPALSA